ncbi:MAG: NAD(P)-dependent alcohol dehydrogenase [Actinomycetota bacterium]
MTSTPAPTTAPTLTASPANTNGATTMKAVTQDRYGDSSALSIATIDRPTIAADEVLVEVVAAAVDRGTEHLMTGRPWLIRLAGFGLLRPKQPILGLDVAGIVRQVGADVTRFAVGDEVVGIARGSFAEYAAAKESKLAHKPVAITFEQAAASTVSGIAALQALTDVGGVEPGQRVLVIGASGGVGTFAVQIARALGATVDGVAGTGNVDLVRSLGATEVFDHRAMSITDIADATADYDLVLDIGGRNPVRHLRRLLTARGTLVIVGGENGNRVTGGIGRQLRAVALSPFVGQRLTMFVSTEHHSFIERLTEFLDAGSVVPTIGADFPLGRAIDAVRQIESGRARGKTVICVRDDHAA